MGASLGDSDEDDREAVKWADGNGTGERMARSIARGSNQYEACLSEGMEILKGLRWHTRKRRGSQKMNASDEHVMSTSPDVYSSTIRHEPETPF